MAKTKKEPLAKTSNQRSMFFVIILSEIYLLCIGNHSLYNTAYLLTPAWPPLSSHPSLFPAYSSHLFTQQTRQSDWSWIERQKLGLLSLVLPHHTTPSDSISCEGSQRSTNPKRLVSKPGVTTGREAKERRRLKNFENGERLQ